MKRYLHAFLAGAWGVMIAWCIFFVIRVEYYQAYEIAEIFASHFGFYGLGRFVVSFSILLGGLLGGAGALVGFSVATLLQEFRFNP